MLKKTSYLLMLLIAAVFISSCIYAPNKTNFSKFPLCNSSGKNSIGELSSVYKPLLNSSCKEALQPFDLSIWLTSVYNSRKIRGEQKVILGCKPLTPTSENCNTSRLLGQSSSAMMNFDMTTYQDQSVVKRAVLALYSPDDVTGLKDVVIRGRMNIGLPFRRVGVNPYYEELKGERKSGWILFDITNFAAEAINQRRNSVSFEIAYPCDNSGKVSSELSLLDKLPRIIVEYN